MFQYPKGEPNNFALSQIGCLINHKMCLDINQKKISYNRCKIQNTAQTHMILTYFCWDIFRSFMSHIITVLTCNQGMYGHKVRERACPCRL